MRRTVLCAAVLLVWGLAAAVTAREAAEGGVVTIDGARIVGDQEVPTVMYLVPWQPPEVEALPESRALWQVGDEHQPLDRYEFRRQVHYQSLLLQQGGATDSPQN